ncbi:MAG TPA: XRE family transcriptional regulator [Candidatus Fimimorpha faecalis]|uniref:XRE family transcriptional regulator n=1 Tax=Candidatus Fimimorpha faecalis TaxID=2840824 RepID=A0A9D1JCJ8_9FIRM|nr:XRE family transcriptional regulator [Candidatus Fimimorpha faecalis]
MRIDRVKLVMELAKRCWSIKKLAEVSGVSRQTIDYIKQGQSISLLGTLGNKGL